MSSQQQRLRQQNRKDELSAATLRSFSLQDDLLFRAHQLYSGQMPLIIQAAHLKVENSRKASIATERALVDAWALRFAHNHTQLHISLCPQQPVARLVFELLEQFRLEALVAERFPGSKKNLQQNFLDWVDEFYHSGLTESSLGILLFTVALVFRRKINQTPLSETLEDLVEATRAGLGPVIGQYLVKLKTNIADQKQYGIYAAELGNQIAALAADEIEEILAEGENSAATENEAKHSGFRLLLKFEGGDAAAFPVAESGESRSFLDATQGYQVFTRKYDREIAAQTSVRAEQLVQLRQQLDQQVANSTVNVARLAQKFRQLFAVLASREWEYGQEEGYIDGRRLAGIVSSPAERRVFCRQQLHASSDAHISILLDCSGSMKAHIELIAVFIDVLCRALDRADISTEVLGFTTGGWNGGRTLKDWKSRGIAKYPGRLNERLHIIFKSAEETWIRSRKNLGALIKTDWFREGIDGEAVSWACSRLHTMPQRRRILMVLSDGCPMDAATAQANDAYYLDNHLRKVLAEQEAKSDVEIYGIGVELDMSPYYRHSLVLDLAQGVTANNFQEFIQLLLESQRHF